jgi:hypothetical protein
MGTRLSVFFKLLNVSFSFFHCLIDCFFKRNVYSQYQLSAIASLQRKSLA